jgi:hypothetical protein|tara:strand:- start:2 stop:358 length:357 start_codon:yes stop_codon:yes gene_type:complete
MGYKRKRISGVYEIKNIKTEKYYIGKSVDCFNRWQSHLQQLLYNKHHNEELQTDFNEGHYSYFQFRILKIQNKKYISKLEKETIQRYLRRNKYLYNIAQNPTKINIKKSKEKKDPEES